MARHTQGKWKVYRYGKSVTVGTIGGTRIADNLEVGLPEAEAEAEANAELIADGPELLAAIGKLREAFYVKGTSKALKAAFEETQELYRRHA